MAARAGSIVEQLRCLNSWGSTLSEPASASSCMPVYRWTDRQAKEDRQTDTCADKQICRQAGRQAISSSGCIDGIFFQKRLSHSLIQTQKRRELAFAVSTSRRYVDDATHTHL